MNEYENQGARCDTLMWLEGLKNEGSDNQNLRKIAQTMKTFRSKLNKIS